MVWHIFRKDFRMLWPVAALAAGLQAGLFLYEIIKEPFSYALSAINEESWIGNAVLIGAAALAVLAVQQDPLPGVEADWLVRPIRRSRLLLAKLLFLGLTLHLPMFLLDMLACHLAGGDLGPSLAAAASRNMLFFCVITLPLLAAAAITKNIAAFVGLVILYQLGLNAIQTLSGLPWIFPNENWVGASWITTIAKYIVMMLGAAIVLALQYFSRKTTISRIALPLLLLSGALLPALPWQAAFGVQQMLSPAPAAAGSISMSFAPNSPRVQRNPKSGDMLDDAVQIFVPIQIAGLAADRRLFVDRQTVTALTEGGRKQVSGMVSGGTTAVNADGEAINGFYPLIDPAARTYAPLGMTRKDLAALDESGATVIVDYALTLSEKEGEEATLNPTQEFLAVPGWGRCRTPALQGIGIALTVQCLSVGERQGLSVLSAYSPDGERAFAVGSTSFYTPVFAALLPDAVLRNQEILLSRRGRIFTQIPPDTRFVFTHYRPLAHFRYRLVIHDVKLADWVMLPSAE